MLCQVLSWSIISVWLVTQRTQIWKGLEAFLFFEFFEKSLRCQMVLQDNRTSADKCEDLIKKLILQVSSWIMWTVSYCSVIISWLSFVYCGNATREINCCEAFPKDRLSEVKCLLGFSLRLAFSSISSLTAASIDMNLWKTHCFRSLNLN